MKFKNLVLFYFLVILLISPIYILGEQISNFKEIEPGGNYQKRKLADSNYIIVKYYAKTEYTSFNSKYRNGISYIINEDKIYNLTDSFTIEENNSIEIHFSSPVTTLYHFFAVDDDPNAVNITSIDFSNFDSSSVTNIAGMFYNCKNLESLDISNFNTLLVTNSEMMFDGLDSINYINLSNIIDNNQLKSALSQFLNNNTDHNVIICQSQTIINNTNAISTCEYNNYIIAQYDSQTKYTKFKNNYRNEISYIVNENTIFKNTETFTIPAKNSIEIHFSSPVKSLNYFFSRNSDQNSEYIVSVDFSHFD